jgi:uncharacterized membrane protein
MRKTNMLKSFSPTHRALLASTAVIAALAAAPASAGGKPVDLLTAVPAESEKIFSETIERAGGINTFAHAREPATVDTQTIVRSQSDMLYSQGVFDVSEGMTVTVPEGTTGYQSVLMFDANHGQIGVVYCGESREVTADEVSTEDKHIYAMMRTSTDKGVKAANAAQDAVKMEPKSATEYVGPGYDQEQLAEAKRMLAGGIVLVKNQTAYAKELIPGTVLLKDGTDLEKYNYIFTSLLGWGLMPLEDAYYNNVVIKEADCTEVTFAKPPVDYENLGYWSLTAYNMEGYLGTDNAALSAYKAESNDDGSFSVFVGNSEDCKSKANRIDMPEGGAALTLRMYRPTSLEAAKEFETKFVADNNGK